MIMAIAKDAISGENWLVGYKEYCAIITLDVKNAFNFAAWDATLAALDGKDVPNYLLELVRYYFNDRVLLYDTDGGKKSYGRDVDEACSECRNERETAEHVFFTCPRYINQRNRLERTMGLRETPDNIVNLMLSSCDNWNPVCVFARRVLMQQRLTERARSAKFERQHLLNLHFCEVILACGPGGGQM